MNDRTRDVLYDRLARLRAIRKSLPVSHRRFVLQLAIDELEAELDREEEASVMRFIAPGYAPAQAQVNDSR